MTVPRERNSKEAHGTMVITEVLQFGGVSWPLRSSFNNAVSFHACGLFYFLTASTPDV